MIPSDISRYPACKYLNHLRPATILGDNSTPACSESTAGALSMAKILIVDDNPDVREVLRCQLEMLGYLVISAENGYTGIAKAIAEQPDLILMDIMMPEMDGCRRAGPCATIPRPRTSRFSRLRRCVAVPISMLAWKRVATVTSSSPSQ